MKKKENLKKIESDELKKIKEVIKLNKIDMESDVLEYQETEYKNSVSLETGSNEGYYVKIQIEKNVYSLRFHDRMEAVKTLNIMLCFVKNN